jgi:hypothetical protein
MKPPTAFHLCLMLLALSAGGCWTVAGGVVGGTILAGGSYLFSNSFEETTPLPLDQVRPIASAALREMKIHVLDVTPRTCGQTATRYTFRAVVLGDEPMDIDLDLVAISPRLTRIVARCKRAWNLPDHTTAKAVVTRIVALAKPDIPATPTDALARRAD